MIGRGRDLSRPRDQMELTVKAHEPLRLDLYLREALVWKSRRRIQDLIRRGHIKVNGAPAKPSQGVRGGDRIQVRLSMGTGVPEDYGEREVSIIYEDRWLVAIDKPPGLLVHPVGRHVYDTLMNYLHYRYQKGPKAGGRGREAEEPESVSKNRPALFLRRPTRHARSSEPCRVPGAEAGEAACRGRRGGGSASPTNKGTQSPSTSCSGSESLSKYRSSEGVRRPTGAEEREAACRGRRGGGSASPTNRETQSLSNSCSGSETGAPARGRYRGQIRESLSINLCHRIDKDTTGIVLVGKEGYVHKRVQWQFQTRKVSKEYLTLAAGTIPPGLVEIQVPIGEGGSLEEALAPPLKPARTAIHCLERFSGPAGEFSLVLARPVTGRQNQIRVHLAAAGFPIAGDVRYGGPAVPGFPERYLLHARWIRFFHPRLKSSVELVAPPPADFKELIEKLRGS